MSEQTEQSVFRIPEGSLETFAFDHKNVRAYIQSAFGVIGTNPEAKGYGKASVKVTFVVRPEQPENPELEEIAGTEVEVWFRAYGKGLPVYKRVFTAMGQDLYNPDLPNLKNTPVIIDIKTNGDFINVDRVELDA